jgi:hypothetical protein
VITFTPGTGWRIRHLGHHPGGLAMDKSLDLDAPEELAIMLRAAAERYAESRTEWQAAWQDRNAGRVWSEFARILERAAAAADKAVKKYV